MGTTEGTGAFIEKMNAMPKYIASSTHSDPEWDHATRCSTANWEQR